MSIAGARSGQNAAIERKREDKIREREREASEKFI
jgi:hypothetical protein